MIIKELNLISFGKFTNKVISFENGINLLYGENESGKSTIMSFVQFMFYGSNTKKSNIAENLKLKYMPWNSEIIEGELTYSLDGTDYIIHRKAGKRSSVDVINKNTGESLGSDISKNIGIHILGLSEDAFIKTLFISQSSTATGPDKDGLLVKKLSNLGKSADEGGSYTKVKKQIEEEVLNLSSPRRSGAIIPNLKSQTDELTQKLSDILENIESIEASKSELDKIALEIKNLTAQRDKLKEEIDLSEKSSLAEEFKAAEEKYNLAKEKYDTVHKEYSKIDLTTYSEFENISEDALNKITQDSGDDVNRLNSLVVFAKEKATSSKNMCVASTIGFVICAVLGFIYPIFFAAMGILAVIAAYGLISFNQQNKKASETEDKVASLKSEKNALLSKYGCDTVSEFVKKHSEYMELTSTKTSLKTSLEFLENEMILAKERLDKISQEIISKYDKLENVLNIFYKCDNIGNINDKKEDLEKVSSSIIHLKTKQAIITEKLANQSDIFEDFISTKENIEHNSKLMAEYEKRLETLKLALDILDDSFDEIKNNFAPKLSKNIGKILAEITDDKYQNIVINHNFDTRLDSGKGFYESPYFSGGTIDQLYFAVRFGIIETIKENTDNYPVFLDDVFCQCDAKRLIGAVEFLKKYSMSNQIIYATCHEREKTAFENAGLSNTIKL